MNIDVAHSTWLTLGAARAAMVVGLVNAMPDNVVNLHERLSRKAQAPAMKAEPQEHA